MATVYRGVADGQEVAIKIMNPELAKESRFVRRFRREAKAASVLRNPNTVQILEFGVDQGYVFLAMELLRGFDLAMLLHKEKRVAEGRALRIVAQVCRALSFAHKQSIVHRDLKPDNIMLVKIPDGVKAPVPGCLPQDFVKVLDFGIAKILDDDGSDKPAVDSRAEPVTQEKSMLTRVGTIVGTPAYMAPEQGRAEPVDGRTDLYACGVLLYELITGRVPFVGETPMQVVMRHVNEPPRPPSELCKIHPEVEKVILRALAKFAAGRQQSAEEMEAEILGVLAKVDPVTTGPTPPPTEVEGANKTLVIETSLPDEVGGGIDPAGLGFPTLNIEVPDDLLPPNIVKGSDQPATRRVETPIGAPREASAAIPVVNAGQKARGAPLDQTMQSLAAERTELHVPRPPDPGGDDDEEPATMVKAPPQGDPRRMSLAEEAMARMLKGGPDVPSVAGPESVEPTLVAAQAPEQPRAAPPAPPKPPPKPHPHETTAVSEPSHPTTKPSVPATAPNSGDEKRQLGLAETVRLDADEIELAQQARSADVEKKDAPIRRPTSELVPVVLDEEPAEAPKAPEPAKVASVPAAAVWTPEPKKKLGGGAALFLGIAIGAVLVAVGLGVVMLLR
jgi:serine/threonine protein kinase